MRDFSLLNYTIIGDSISLGQDGVAKKIMDKTFCTILKERLGFKTATNLGIGWSTMAHVEVCNCHDFHNAHDPMCERYEAIPVDSDIISVSGGVNDRGLDVPLGTIDSRDKETFLGAYNFLLDKILERCPKAWIFILSMTPTSRSFQTGLRNKQNLLWDDYNNATIELAKARNIDYLVMSDIKEIICDLRRTESDGVHPSQECVANYIEPKIEEFIITHFRKIDNECIKLRFPNFKKKALTLSYDDGTIFDKDLLCILNKYNLKCTFNLSSNFLVDNVALRKGRRLIKSEAVSLYKNFNCEIALHGFNHLNLTSLSEEEMNQEIKNDKAELDSIFSSCIIGAAYPYGGFNDTVLKQLENNKIKYCRTTLDTNDFSLPRNWLTWNPTCHHDSEKLFTLVDEFLNSSSDELQLFYLWGHSYEFNDNNNWDVILNFCKKVCNNGKIWYATNGEIYCYLEAFENLKFNNTNLMFVNNSSFDIFLEYEGKNIVIPSKSKYSL